jgi:serine/threonine protein kinase
MIGRTIQQYRILERLGAGGMGEIYKAQDTRLNRLVAIKVLSTANGGDSESRRRFMQEAQAASTLNHPNIITIYDILTEDDLDFMVMEFVQGKTLAETLAADGPFKPAMVLQYSIQIADGLAAAHAAGIVHRDLKPGNIMVTPQGRVKILDFGLAKMTVPRGPVSLSDVTETVGPAPMTQQGAIVGTVSYMSPEQAQGSRVDARSDIFSLGSVLYELLTGKKAFPGDTPLLILTAILRDEPKPIEEYAPEAPTGLVSTIHRALRKQPAQRWNSMEEMHDELQTLKQRLDSGILQAPALPEMPPPSRLSRGALIAGVVCLLLVGAGFWAFRSRSSAPAPPSPPQVSTKARSGSEVKPSAMPPPALTNDAVIEMTKANLSPDVIIGQIRSSQTAFNLSTPELIRLGKAGVPSQVIQAMRNPKAPVDSAGAAAGTPSTTGEPPRVIRIIGGEPLPIVLTEDVSADCQPGQVLHFQTAREVSSAGVVAIAKGAPVKGVVVDSAHRKFLVHTSRPTFRLIDVTAVDGTKLKIRAMPGKLGDERKDRPLDPIGGSKSKDSIAPAGSRFMAYFDGDQTLTLRPPDTSK